MAVVGCGPGRPHRRPLPLPARLQGHGLRGRAPSRAGCSSAASRPTACRATCSQKEIASLLDENITLKCGTALGRDFTLDGLLARRLQGRLPGPRRAQEPAPRASRARTSQGVHPVDAVPQGLQPARREPGRGTRRRHRRRQLRRRRRARGAAPGGRRERHHPLPADPRGDAGLRRGDRGRARRRASSSRRWSRRSEILAEDGRLTGVECIRNALGELRRSGRRRPVPVAGQRVHGPAGHADRGDRRGAGHRLRRRRRARADRHDATGTVQVDPETLATNRPACSPAATW